MSTPITQTTPVAPLSPILPAATSTASSLPTLTPSNFLNLMVTQLQNQDPLNPTSSSDMLAQMSQIGQLQASTSLQTTLQSFGLQTSLSAASSMIGKSVQGLDPNGAPLSGVVTSVQVQSGNVSLSLDSGQSLALASVTSVAPGPSGTVAATTTMSAGTTTPIVAGH